MLAPDSFLARGLVDLVHRALVDPDELKEYHRDWLDDPSWSRLELGRAAVLTGLAGGMLGTEPFLVLCDWRDNADDIHEQLRRVPSRPPMSWDQNAGSSNGPAQYPRDAEDYLRETARQSREAGMALIRITRGDSYQLCFVPLERSGLLLSDAVAAGYTQETDYLFEIIDG
ncbi:DUF6630 family protein [Nocardia tengchongensis]|uniref:DUF6630 family protein n=1 Tax=Nocardia tengchongensis TaxID=2055889 RepID=UPI00368CBF4A